MPPSAALQSSLVAIVAILAGLAAVALVERVIPLHAPGRWGKAHVLPNLALTLVTLATNLVFNVALVLTLVRLESRGLGLLQLIALPPLVAGTIAVLVLDLSFYVAHVAMHAHEGLWAFHRVHHSDPFVDVTTTIRQHPGEGVLRYVFLTGFAVTIGASPGAFAVYRVWSVLNGFLEHANVRMPPRLDALLSLVVTTPNMHKVHHSRRVEETDTNYGNIFALFDRLFGTFTPSARGMDIAYGLDGCAEPALQTTTSLLALPFRKLPAQGAAVPSFEPRS